MIILKLTKSFFQKSVNALTRIVRKIFDRGCSPVSPITRIARTTIEDLPSEVLLEIFSTLSGKTCWKCASTCKGFNSLSQEQTIRQAEALYKINRETGLLKKFGVLCEEKMMTLAAARDVLASTKRLVEHCNECLPKAFCFKQSSSDLIIDRLALKSFLEKTYKYTLCKALGGESRVPEDASLDDKVKRIQQWVKSDEAQGLELLHGMDNSLIIHSEICELKGLQMLLFRRSELTSIPVEIDQLTRLKILYLSRNRLTSIPVEISQLTGLRMLYLEGLNLALPLPKGP